MVPSPAVDVLPASDSASPNKESITLSQPTATPSDSAGPPEISGLDGYRQNLITGEVSEDTAICSAPIPGGEALQGLTTAPGNSGVVGVANGRFIYFTPLWTL